MATTGKKQFEKLPTDVVPVEYNVKLQPDLVNLTFKGWETVTAKVKNATNRIIVNAFDMTVDKATLSAADTGRVQVPEIQHMMDVEKVEFHFSETIQPGEYLLSLEFTGFLNDQLRGFYRNKYTAPDGEVRYAAGTHFEATGARRAYPCWDEPSLKAQFVFTLVVPCDRVALSNMPVEEECVSSEDPNLKVLKFQTTPVMSTYLTAFVVGEYDYVEDVTKNGIPVRVFTPVGKKEQGRFALEVATKALSYYEWYFDVPYGLPKLDLITLSEFPIGAMENWGLVTYRETCLLVDQTKSSTHTLHYVALVVTHELSHNWFGNLVTMEWWTDLWLKEGFATWMEYLCTDSLYPEFNIWLQFIKNDQSSALHLDALSSSHPVEVEVGHPGEIDEIFDSISYSKGASLIHMLQAYIGDEAFRKGMKLYLNKHKFKNTSTSHMWDAMSEASGEDVGRVMDSWTKQMGFPLIKVEEVVDPNSTSRQVILTQEKFSAQSDSDLSKQTWMVPYSIVTASSPRTPVAKGLMDGASVTVSLDNCKPGDWIKVNPGQFMFYHVQYEPASLQRLTSAITDDILLPEDRVGLLTDLFALCVANYISAVDVLKIMKSFRDETNFAVAGNLANSLSALGPLIKHVMDGHDGFKTFIRSTFHKFGDRLGWEATPEDSHGTKLLRDQVLGLLGRAKHEGTIAEATRRFQEHCSKKCLLSPDIKSAVYITVLSNGGEPVFDQLMEFYDQEDSLEEKNRIGRLLGIVDDENLKKKVLQFALSNKVRNQDTVGVLSGVCGSAKGKELVWQFVQENWDELYRRYGTSTMLGRVVKVVTNDVCCADRAAEIRAFFKTHEAKAATRSIEQGLEHIEANILFIRKQGPSLQEYLTGFSPGQGDC